MQWNRAWMASGATQPQATGGALVAAGGRIAFPRTSRQFHEQARRLRAEGVRVAEGRVDRRALTELT